MLFNDPHGTADYAIAPATNTLTRRRTDPFGADRAAPPASWPNSQGFLGGTQETSTGLIHLGAREYDPTRGRFVSADPVVDLSNPQQLNGYAYAENNPTTWSDPTGLMVPHESGGGTNVGWGEGYVDPDTGGRPGLNPGGNKGPATPQRSTAQDQAQQNVNNATQHQQQAKKKIQEAAIKIVKVIADELGITAGLDCIRNGDASACGETAVNILSSFAGGMAGKMLAKYGPPWKWRKAAALSRKLFGLVDEATDALRGWHKASKELDEARTGLRKATEAASCSANSFTAETPVLLADGTERPIEQVKVGDQVQATDPQTGETGARPVTQLIRHTGPHTMVDLTLADGSVLHTTDHHPLWDATTNRFAHAIDLHPGEQLQRPDGTLLTLAAVVIRQQNLTAYNLTIAGIHTYYAGTTPLLVHNSCGPGPRGGKSLSAARGREAHASADYGSGFTKEFRIPGSGRRPDAVNFDTREILELKPNNSRAIQRGTRQVNGYVDDMTAEFPGAPWTGKS